MLVVVVVGRIVGRLHLTAGSAGTISASASAENVIVETPRNYLDKTIVI